MKKAILFLVLAVATAHAHDAKESRVEIRPDWSGALKAGEVNLSFQLFDKETKKILADKDLQLMHEKLVHMFLFDPAMGVYVHEHPEFVGGRWVAKVKLPNTAKYWMWVQGQMQGAEEMDDWTGNLRVDVTGGPVSPLPVPPVLTEIRKGQDNGSIVQMSDDKFRAKRMAMPTIWFSRTDGTPAQITPFLGALAHVVMVPSDGDALLHVHPMEGGHPGHPIPPGHLMLHTFFPAAGDYRAWVQFVDRGQLRTVALNLKVYP